MGQMGLRIGRHLVIRFSAVVLVLLAQIARAAGTSTPPACWSADGSMIVTAARLSDENGIYVLDVEGRKREFIPFPHEVLALEPASVEGSVYVLARHSDGRCYLWSASTMGVAARISIRSVYVGDSPSATHFDCSPDGRYVVFASGSGSDIDLWRIDTVSGEEKRLTSAKGKDCSPSWSPNGKWIAFSSERGGTGGIWVMSPDGSSVRRIADGPDRELHPTWSPGSDSIAYLVKGKREGIYIAPISGGKREQIAVGGKDYCAPVWSSTGKWIAFVYGKNPANLFCTPVDKANGWGPYYQTTFDRAKNLRTDLRAPSWSPTSDRLVFTTFEEGRMSVRVATMTAGHGAVCRDVYMSPGARVGKSGASGR